MGVQVIGPFLSDLRLLRIAGLLDAAGGPASPHPCAEQGRRDHAVSADPVRYQTLVYDNARWEGFAFRGDDIVITTPPKCGTTWTQMVCALLVFQETSFDRTLDLISPWLDMLTRSRESVVADLEAQTHRRFIKTHTPLDGLPWDDRVTYICVSRVSARRRHVLRQPHGEHGHGRPHELTAGRRGPR